MRERRISSEGTPPLDRNAKRPELLIASDAAHDRFDLQPFKELS
jgi:hypothetical protein